MIFEQKLPIMAASLGLAGLMFAAPAFSVGSGIEFGVDESTVPGAFAHNFESDSMDLTYHSCARIRYSQDNPGNNEQDVSLREKGYFWISSFQDIDSVVDSQINYFLANGYHIYGVYEFGGPRIGASSEGPLGERRAYQIQEGNMTLFVDVQQDTQLGFQGCQVAYTNTQDDWKIGESVDVLVGEKSEKEGLSNGDFEVVYANWSWLIPDPLVPVGGMNLLHFNANVTSLGGALDQNHRPEGSGNLFWRVD